MNLVARPFHWERYDKATATEGLQILAWAHTRDNRPALLRIESFPATCQVELPTFVNGRPFTWTADSAIRFVETLARKLGEDHAPVRPQPGHYGLWKKLYYYWGDIRFPMVMLVFRNEDALRHAKNVLNYPVEVEDLGYVKAQVWESEIPTILKFIVRCNIFHCSWISTNATSVEPDDRISTLDQEYMVNWMTLNAVPEAECASWRTYPMVMAYDIEQYCDRHQQFPDKYDPRHVVYLNSVIFQRLDTNVRHRYVILFGDCNDIPPEKLENTVIIKVDREYKIVTEMARLMQQYDPDIMTGYNTLGYDNPTLDARMTINVEDWPVLGRLRGHKGSVIGQDWNSSGASFNIIKMFDAPGRINLDMQMVIKRDGHKFRNYNLDTTAPYFLNGRKKFDMPARRMFEIYEAMLAGLKAGPGTPEYVKGMDDMTEMVYYCVNDSELVLDLIVKLNVWIGAIEMSNTGGVTISDFYTKGQQHRCMSLLYRIGSQFGHVLDMRPPIDIPYQGGYVCDPVAGFHRRVVVQDFESLYPSIIRAFGICYTKLIPPRLDHLIKDEDCLVIEVDCDEMIRLQEEAKGKNSKGKKLVNVEVAASTSTAKPPIVKYGVKRMRFHKKSGPGLMPRLATMLIEQRRVVKDHLKQATDPIEKIRLDKKQLAIKIINNSLYGFQGAREGAKRPFIEGAMCITFLGRMMINRCNSYLISTYNARIAYGDTDSTMIMMPDQIKCDADCKYWGDRIAVELTNLFPEGINMQHEKDVAAVFIKKKNYGYVELDGNDGFKLTREGELDIQAKGVLSARRDNAPWACKVYAPAFIMALKREPMMNVVNILIDNCNRLIRNEVSIDDLTSTKAMGSNYKSQVATMKVFGDELRRLGCPAQPGDRMQFVVVERPPDEKGKPLSLGKRMMLRSMFLEQQSNPEPPKIDKLYYIENMLRGHFDNLFRLVYKTEIEQMPDIMFKPNNRCRYTNLNDVVKMIGKMIRAGVDLEFLRSAISDRLEIINGDVIELEFDV